MPAAFLEALGIHLTPVFKSTVPLEKEKEINTTTIIIIPARNPHWLWPDSHAQLAHRKKETLNHWEFYGLIITFGSDFK